MTKPVKPHLSLPALALTRGSARRLAIALLSATLMVSGHAPLLQAQTRSDAPVRVSQRQQGWDAALTVARVLDSRQDLAGLVLQLDVLDKPVTTYANVVYQIFARVNGRWQQVYTTRGARLISSPSGRLTLPPEFIRWSDLQTQIGRSVNLNTLEFRSIARVSYDVQGRRNQQVSWESTQTYASLPQTTVTQVENGQVVIVRETVITETVNDRGPGRPRPTPPSRRPDPREARGPRPRPEPRHGRHHEHGSFSLAILQSQVTYPEVIARLSVKSRTRRGYREERLLGDFRYRMNQRAQFVRGLRRGDRVVVRLYTPQNQFIGYSEFELLSDFTAVSLVLPSQRSDVQIVRTVYGLDSDRNGSIDQGATVYDYFTRISSSRYEDSRVTFLPSTQGIDTRLFAVRDLPNPPITCTYTNSFQTGDFSLVSRTISVFRSALAPAFLSYPGSSFSVINVSTTTVYEVAQLIREYERIGTSSGSIVLIGSDGNYSYCSAACEDDDDWDDDDWGYDWDDDDDDDDHRGRRSNCNQGIGNGPEGCDPGNSRPRGGSNDEGGRRPGRRR
ncbi:hypothetical protein [Leptolyngbya sp. O-77]|uniref:hypothetical protein n=1 Tax=Leptolyngbya sp. O-77 TaxID=1080068 RepID=UPI00074D418A|nr:hypothetical protein [Leptolyngbya sp. O-77]BAU42729.1 hypothetical protein O77CONTIG1_02551 [Leptolyngbya sp. O-77]